MKLYVISALLYLSIGIGATFAGENSTEAHAFRTVHTDDFFRNDTRYLKDEPDSSTALCSNVIGNSNKVRYCRTRALSTFDPNIKRAVIVIHGSGSNARWYYEERVMPYVPDGVLSTTDILVPQFLEDDARDGSTVLEKHGLGNDYLYWSPGWRQCNNAMNRPSGSSSCSIIDFIVRKLIEYKPNLEQIVVIGHSAGGQFVNRYALTNEVQQYATSQGVTMRYGVSSAGSFAYISARRPYYPSCFDEKCTDWKYGLNNRNDYANRLSKGQIVRNAITRRIYYMVGSLDTQPYTMNDTCCVLAQAKDHVDGMEKYRENIDQACVHAFGRDRCNQYWYSKPEAWKVLPGIGHNSREILNSQHGHNVMYYWSS